MTGGCADDLGPVMPRTCPPAPGWSADGHRSTAPRADRRGPETVWGYGALRCGDGQAITIRARSRTTAGDRHVLHALADAHPAGEVRVITAHLASHKRPPMQEWMPAHPRVQQVVIPTGACWLTLQQPWGRLVRREAVAGQTCADGEALDRATCGATAHRNRRATPWLSGRPRRPRRQRRRCVVYRL